jgi:hypothetical protein
MPGRQDTNPRRMPIRFGTATAQTAARIGRLESGSMRVAADFGVDQLFGVARLAATHAPMPAKEPPQRGMPLEARSRGYRNVG